MRENDFSISYIKEKDNVVVDSLSRKPRIFSLIPLKVDLKERILGQLVKDSWYLKVLSELRNGRQEKPRFEGYKLEAYGLL